VGPSAYAAPEAAYAPASNFSPVPGGYQYLFTVTADASSPVPEPASAIPLAIAIGFGAWCRRKSLR